MILTDYLYLLLSLAVQGHLSSSLRLSSEICSSKSIVVVHWEDEDGVSGHCECNFWWQKLGYFGERGNQGYEE